MPGEISRSFETPDDDSDRREVSCVWCGFKFESTIQSQAMHLYKHATTCKKHPVHKLHKCLKWAMDQIEQYEARLIQLGDSEELVHSKTQMQAKAVAYAALG